MQRIILYGIFLLICTHANAQNAMTNSGNLQLHTGASLSGSGNFTNTSTGVLINNGSLYISGNATNDQASMATGTGTLYLNGTSAQSLNGTQPFRTLNFVSNNTTGITLNNNLSVSGAHTFIAGIISTSATPNYLVYEAGSSYSGDADSRHVNGWVKKFGSTNFIFPVGNATIERSVALTSLSGNSEFNARYLQTTPNNSQRQLPIRDVDAWEYWTVNKVSGGSASVALNWDYSKVYFPNYIISDLVVAGWNGSLWVDNGGTASGNAMTTGNITSGSVSSFNLFTFGSKSWVLPVTLISFTASRQDNYTHIAWTTANEYNADHFVVERSDDGLSFYPISKTPARNSHITEQYTAKDNALVHRIAYYRLRSVDADGKESLSKVVAVTVNSNSSLVLVSNPVRNKIILMAGGEINGEFDYKIAMINGQLTQQGILSIHGNSQYEIPLNGKVQKGVYTLIVSNREQTFNYKFLIQ